MPISQSHFFSGGAFLGLLLSFAAAPGQLWAQDFGNGNQEQQMKDILAVGGKTVPAKFTQGRPVTQVKFLNTQTNDANMQLLQGFNRVSLLILANTRVGDEGLATLAADGLTELRTLNLSGTQVTDAGIPNLAAFTKLEELDLGHTQLTDAGLASLAALKPFATTLKRLKLTGTTVTDQGLANLKSLKKLNELGLGGTKIGDKGLTALSRTMLKLDLGSTQITDAGLEKMKQFSYLEQLDIDHTQISDAGLANLIKAKLEFVTRLRLDQTNCTEAGVRKLRDSFPKAEIVF